MAYTNTTSAPASSLPAFMGTALAAAAARFKQYRMYRQTYNELSALNDRELADLGLCRGDITRISRQAIEL